MKYRTKDGQDYTLPGIGRTVNGIITTDKIIENANFELIEESIPQLPQVAAPQASPAAAPAQTPLASPPEPQTNQGSSI